MNELITDQLKHAPSLLAIVTIVWMFLGFLQKILASHIKRTDEFIMTLREINEDNQKAKELSRVVIERNTQEAMANTFAIKTLTEAIGKRLL